MVDNNKPSEKQREAAEEFERYLEIYSGDAEKTFNAIKGFSSNTIHFLSTGPHTLEGVKAGLEEVRAYREQEAQRKIAEEGRKGRVTSKVIASPIVRQEEQEKPTGPGFFRKHWRGLTVAAIAGLSAYQGLMTYLSPKHPIAVHGYVAERLVDRLEYVFGWGDKSQEETRKIIRYIKENPEFIFFEDKRYFVIVEKGGVFEKRPFQTEVTLADLVDLYAVGEKAVGFGKIGPVDKIGYSFVKGHKIFSNCSDPDDKFVRGVIDDTYFLIKEKIPYSKESNM